MINEYENSLEQSAVEPETLQHNSSILLRVLSVPLDFIKKILPYLILILCIFMVYDYINRDR